MPGLGGTRANSLSSQLRKHSRSPDLISSLRAQCLPLVREGIQEITREKTDRPSLKGARKRKERGGRADVSLSGLAAAHQALERGQNVVKEQKEK